jgi:hypothetical protein
MPDAALNLVAEGRAQAARLRPLGITRSALSPRVVIPDPTPEQLKVLERNRRRHDDPAKDRGVMYPNGTLIIEERIYAKSKPWRRTAYAPSGRALWTAIRNYPDRSWDVIRGRCGKTVLEGVRDYEARIVLSGRATPEEIKERQR